VKKGFGWRGRGKERQSEESGEENDSCRVALVWEN